MDGGGEVGEWRGGSGEKERGDKRCGWRKPVLKLIISKVQLSYTKMYNNMRYALV